MVFILILDFNIQNVISLIVSSFALHITFRNMTRSRLLAGWYSMFRAFPFLPISISEIINTL